MSRDNWQNLIGTAMLGLFGWHLLTLHNISKSVEVLVHQMEDSNIRIDRLENRVYYLTPEEYERRKK